MRDDGENLDPDDQEETAVDEATLRERGLIQEDVLDNGFKVRVFHRSDGWYLAVLNPDPNWSFNEWVGPFETADEAWSEASNVGADGGKPGP